MEYENRDIKELLNSYFAGTTTLEEEQLLRHFYATNHSSDEQIELARPIFEYMACAAATTSARIDLEKITGHNQRQQLSLKRSTLTWIVSSAAAIALALTITLATVLPKQQVYCYLNGHPVNDMELAQEQASMALSLLNSSFNTTKQANTQALRQVKNSLEGMNLTEE